MSTEAKPNLDLEGAGEERPVPMGGSKEISEPVSLDLQIVGKKSRQSVQSQGLRAKLSCGGCPFRNASRTLSASECQVATSRGGIRRDKLHGTRGFLRKSAISYISFSEDLRFSAKIFALQLLFLFCEEVKSAKLSENSSFGSVCPFGLSFSFPFDPLQTCPEVETETVW